MVVLTRTLKIKYYNGSTPIEYFLQDRNGQGGLTKETCFVRYIGIDKTEDDYRKLIESIDDQFVYGRSPVPYIRIHELNNYIPMEDVGNLKAVYASWLGLNYNNVKEIIPCALPFELGEESMKLTQKKGFIQVLQVYKKHSAKVTESMVQNFGVKLLFWIQTYLPALFCQSKPNIYPKLIYTGNIKLQEFLFLYYLTLLGCDVLYMNPTQDVDFSSESIKNLAHLSQRKMLALKPVSLKEYQRKIIEAPQEEVHAAANIQPAEGNRQTPPYMEQTKPPVSVRIPNRPSSPVGVTSAPLKRQLEYEELAAMAASVVMIKVYDKSQKCFKTGSGVVINQSGYILTNFHVVSDGVGFGIRYENEEQEYYTNNLVKYHNINDLALLKVDKSCIPIEVYKGKDMVRGQKVVAIGSPLGLFNTVSDGIVSGFRQINEVQMIQFTAPISSGSSGGALLNMSGQLVGLLTAGFDEGQNLNLAVGYEILKGFLRGFI